MRTSSEAQEEAKKPNQQPKNGNFPGSARSHMKAGLPFASCSDSTNGARRKQGGTSTSRETWAMQRQGCKRTQQQQTQRAFEITRNEKDKSKLTRYESKFFFCSPWPKHNQVLNKNIGELMAAAARGFSFKHRTQGCGDQGCRTAPNYTATRVC